MAEIIPAVLPKNYEDLKNKISLVRGAAPVVQIDICDGRFVPSTTWPFLGDGRLDEHFVGIQNDREGLPFWEDIDFELDLMTLDAVENFDVYLKLGPRRMIFHLDAVAKSSKAGSPDDSQSESFRGDLQEFKEFIEGMDFYVREATEIGIAASLDVDADKVIGFLSIVDFVQVMGIERVGFQAQDFDERALDYVKTLREKNKDVPIAVDGGVNLETAEKIIAAGASRLCIGSAIFKTDDIIKAIEEFRSLN